MAEVLASAGMAVAVWWASTVAILWRVKRADRLGGDAHTVSVLMALPMVFLGLWGVRETGARTDVAGVQGAFLSALAIWGWVELAFLSGIVTGPSRAAGQPGARGWMRFGRAFGTLAHHEIALLLGLGAVALSLQGAENLVALWTYLTLLGARISAKLNLFLGVPRFHAHLLPDALAHLPSHFGRARMNWLFPFSVTALSAAVAWWAHGLISAGTTGGAAAAALLMTLTALALLEHWLMVLPLPDEKLWRWAVPAPDEKTKGKT
ncbi:putative photosynthetic complex assembly protein 2 [Hasllibacter halocynthiae]|uniref:Putative photosynthetic complex assembly protein 2 n=1 Tax=Hasllibacter halocynthiae TaxID=595589 RepID=A0A2T0X2R6_9RHOB|nr:putative photosynthetic complex assembly protein PuhE [Hasllibacter halocynthiae]PRY93249.1 putative photosynthetic complex assembly protein 2 [Hasllibacter halocynthiae]